MIMLADACRLLSMPIGLFVIGGTIAIVAIVFGSITKIIVSRGKERTRREIAAYVAEGSIDPDKAVAMLNAGHLSAKEDIRKEVQDGVDEVKEVFAEFLSPGRGGGEGR